MRYADDEAGKLGCAWIALRPPRRRCRCRRAEVPPFAACWGTDVADVPSAPPRFRHRRRRCGGGFAVRVLTKNRTGGLELRFRAAGHVTANELSSGSTCDGMNLMTGWRNVKRTDETLRRDRPTDRLINQQMDRKTHPREITDGQKDGRQTIWIDGRMDEWNVRWIDGRTDGMERTDGRTDGHNDKRTFNWWTEEHMNGLYGWQRDTDR